jgi:hypothetical protein
MVSGRKPLAVYTERGAKRAFAGAIEWPGWCRRGRGEDDALEALIAYAPRYAVVVRGMKPPFPAPADLGALKVVEQLKGDATTDFGAPSIAPEADARAVSPAELQRLVAFLKTGWAALDTAVSSADGVELSKGPRGGGRDLASIVEHVTGAEAGYVHRLATKSPPTQGAGGDPSIVGAVREVEVEGLTRAVREGLPAAGPKGGKLWLPRYFVRRTLWHALDHAWEIEDRATP